MNDNVLILLVLLTGAIIGFVLGFFIANLKKKNELTALNINTQQAQQRIDELKQLLSKNEATITQIRKEEKIQLEQLRATSDKAIENLRIDNNALQNQLTAKKVAFENLQKYIEEKNDELENLQTKFEKNFELVANKLLDEKSTKFSKQNEENLDKLLKPFKEKIEHFERKVEDTNKEAILRGAQLREQIKNLSQLNELMSKEANNLTKALKGDSKMQGNWGELVLERVLEKSNLRKDSEYSVQQSFTREDGSRVLPDVIINLPGGKKMIIDSKVTLTAYERFVNAETEEESELALKEHLAALNRHITQLSEKNYHDLYHIESPDFVLLFVPIEPAFAIAVQKDNKIYNDAFAKNIVIVTPTTLLATLRTIDTMWNNEKQQRNALEIALQAGRLYDQFVLLTEDLIKVGNQLRTVQGSYDSTMKKLTGKGNLIKKVEGLKQLGIKQKKHLNEKLVERANEAEE